MISPSISVIIVNYNGVQHLDACLRSLAQQDYAPDRVEVLLVDNASTDGSQAFVRERYPHVRVIQNEGNIGFAPAVNQAAHAATGDYIALINNDAYAAPTWLRVMVELAERRKAEGVACVAARILDWYGKLVDFDGAGVSFYGYGGQRHFRLPAERVRVREGPLLFACGGAMLCDRRVFLESGCFDESYFAYFEDVDFGWRLWVLGYQVWMAPEAVIYHRHHGTSGRAQAHQKYTLLERNALATIVKNYDDVNLARVLPAALLLLLKKSLMSAGPTIERRDFDLASPPLPTGRFDVPTVDVLAPALSYVVGANVLLDDLPGLYARRAAVQGRRRRPDAEILPLFQQPFARRYPTPEYAMLQEQIVSTFGIDALFGGTRPTRVVVLSTDPIRSELAGTGIRALEIARVLVEHCQVTLAAVEECSVRDERIETLHFSYAEPQVVEELCKEADVIVTQGAMLNPFPFLATTDAALVVDLYTPLILESLQFTAHYPRPVAQLHFEQTRNDMRRQLLAGDFFICASERQRDFWLGALADAGRLNPHTFPDDMSLRRLIDVAPFGIDAEPPAHTRPVLKGVHPGIAADDTLLIWNGGIWEWFDPLTILRALAMVRDRRPDLKLFFMGAGHPNKVGVPTMPMANVARSLAEELGLLNETVFFNDGWVPYAERGAYLLEADIGVSAHFDTAETRLSFRTRLLDCIWAGLPVIVSSGDELSALTAELGLGRVVAPRDVEGWAAALLDLAAVEDRRARFAPAFARAQERLRWERTLAPLVAYCKAPRHSADAVQKRALLDPPAQADAAQSEYVQQLEGEVARKNGHIARLEELVRGMENGRVMRALKRLRR
jgi:GT2 family glycosyltransferase/glycosyltransferase involved in cell wall biosynthesis